MDVLRANELPVTRAQLDVAWLTDTVQRDRALDSLLADGLVTKTSDGRFALVGEDGLAGAVRNDSTAWRYTCGASS